MVYTKETMYCWWPQYYWKEHFYSIFKVDFRFFDFQKNINVLSSSSFSMAGDWKKNHEILKSDSWNIEFLGMFFSFHERKSYIHRKRNPSFITYFILHSYNCLLSAICELVPPNQISYLSPSHHTPATHILPHPEPEVKLPAQSEILYKHCKWSSRSAWSHWRTQKQALISWWAESNSLHRVMANVQLNASPQKEVEIASFTWKWH